MSTDEKVKHYLRKHGKQQGNKNQFTYQQVLDGDHIGRKTGVWTLFQIFSYLVSCCKHKLQRIKPLTNGKSLDWTKLKAFAGEKLKIADMMISVFGRKH